MPSTATRPRRTPSRQTPPAPCSITRGAPAPDLEAPCPEALSTRDQAQLLKRARFLKASLSVNMFLLHTSTVIIIETEVALTAGMSLLSDLPVPVHGLGMVLLYTLTVIMHDTEVALSFGMSLLGGLSVPAHGLGMVLLYTLTVIIRDTEVVLTAGMSLLGGLPVPAHGLGMVLLHTSTVWLC